MDDIPLLVHHDVSRRKSLHDPVLDRAPQVGSRRCGLVPHLAGGRKRAQMRHREGEPQRADWMIPTLEDALLLVQRREQVSVLGNIFRSAEKQITALAESKMEHRDNLSLKIAAEIDQQ